MHISGNLAKTFELVEALSSSHLHIQVKKEKKKKKKKVPSLQRCLGFRLLVSKYSLQLGNMQHFQVELKI
jgi:hypothetical protein